MQNAQGEAVKSVVDEYDEESMVEELALRAFAIREDPSLAGQYNPEVTADAEHLGISDDLKELGNRIFRRTARELHEIVCGSAAEDRKDRESLLSAIGANDVMLGAAIASALITALGMAPALATIVAALLIKRIFKPAGKEVCKFWSEKLGTN